MPSKAARVLFAIGDGFLDGSGEIYSETLSDLVPRQLASADREIWLRQSKASALKGYLSQLNFNAARNALKVSGGYTDRFPLACVKSKLIDYAEKWFYTRVSTYGVEGQEQELFGYRTFRRDTEQPPFHSSEMSDFLRVYGVPHILCAWGLGVSEEILQMCRTSFKIYYSTDAPPLRVPLEVSSYFDLILTGENWQKDEVHLLHPDTPCEILPIGPEFADPGTFRPLGLRKEYDLIYVAAARAYKCHDVLFHALARCSRSVRCLCLFGYGHEAEWIIYLARELKIDVDFIGPPGVSYEEVNYHMNRARVGVVAGFRDGCPSILTEYMLAGLPVLANSQLCCGLGYITPSTGLIAPPEAFHIGIEEILERYAEFRPREYAEEHWSWPVSVKKLQHILRKCGYAS